MDEVLAFLQDNHTYFLATCEGDQPRVRPFGTAAVYDGKLYIQTGKVKKVSDQMIANPKVEICALSTDGSQWLRIAATAVLDESLEAQTAVMAEYPELQGLYQPGDGNCEVFYLKDAVATFCSFTAEPREVRF